MTTSSVCGVVRRQKSGRNSKESAKKIPSDFWWIYIT
jgi:hypothetical protein